MGQWEAAVGDQKLGKEKARPSPPHAHPPLVPFLEHLLCAQLGPGPWAPATPFSSSAVASSWGVQAPLSPLTPALTSPSGPFLKVPKFEHSGGEFHFLLEP